MCSKHFYKGNKPGWVEQKKIMRRNIGGFYPSKVCLFFPYNRWMYSKHFHEGNKPDQDETHWRLGTS
jgi:hypothetical protein